MPLGRKPLNPFKRIAHQMPHDIGREHDPHAEHDVAHGEVENGDAEQDVEQLPDIGMGLIACNGIDQPPGHDRQDGVECCQTEHQKHADCKEAGKAHPVTPDILDGFEGRNIGHCIHSPRAGAALSQEDRCVFSELDKRCGQRPMDIGRFGRVTGPSC